MFENNLIFVCFFLSRELQSYAVLFVVNSSSQGKHIVTSQLIEDIQ